MGSEMCIRDRTNAERAGSLMGTPEYMAPEMLRGQGFDCRVDFWSLGCTCYEMFAQRTPFANAEQFAVNDDLAPNEDPVRALLRAVLLAEVVYTGAHSAPARAFIGALLTRDVQARPACAADLRGMPFFAKFDWEARAGGPGAA